MHLKVWQANTTGEDAGAYMASQGATGVKRLDGGEHPEFEADMYVDCDEDVLRALAVMLWYNDRSEAQIAGITGQVRALLAANARQDGRKPA